MKPDSVYLGHILQEIEFLIDQTANLSYSEFLENEVLKKAVVRSFEVIGEAAKNVSGEFQSEHPEIPWRGITGLRNQLIHQYFKVNYAQVWEIITDDIPVLYEQVSKILEK